MDRLFKYEIECYNPTYGLRPSHPPSPDTISSTKAKETSCDSSKKPMIKPKIFHSHCARIVNSVLSSSGISSHNGQEGTHSSSKALEPKARMKLDDLQ
ncbi:ERMES complex subunit [Puccinia graminis f. sp. tritici]|uniref:ERMES complex subunit n=1 Tax=Puccinia graminis f. sp. tritici TaxID=56615 RepID=A0A5B0R3B5_PUCGR|nr:ERMES complex subunit [Puccinia graminis f. sp. tritici]